MLVTEPNPNPNINSNPNFERRLDEVCEGLPPYMKRHLLEKIPLENALAIVEYVQALRMETNLSTFYKQAVIDINISFYILCLSHLQSLPSYTSDRHGNRKIRYYFLLY